MNKQKFQVSFTKDTNNSFLMEWFPNGSPGYICCFSALSASSCSSLLFAILPLLHGTRILIPRSHPKQKHISQSSMKLGEALW